MAKLNIAHARISWPDLQSDIEIVGSAKDSVFVVTLQQIESAFQSVAGRRSAELSIEWMICTCWPDGVDQIVVTNRVNNKVVIDFTVRR